MLSRLVKNSFSLLITNIIDKLAYAVFFAVIARKLSTTDFGAYNLFLTVLLLGGMVSEFGIGTVITREIAKCRDRGVTLFNNALLITTVFSFIAWPLMIGICRFLHYPDKVVLLLWFGGMTFVFIGIRQIAAAVIKAYERMDTI